jgi:DNA-binding Lrp family transcriptional regulator
MKREEVMYAGSLTNPDRQLLSALREDGRASVASLSRKLGVTRATINSRLERLVSSGTIVGFTARVRDELDPLSIHAITLIAVEGRAADKVIRQLRGFPEIRTLHTTNGAWDLVAELRADSLTGFDQILGRIRSIEGILNSETSLLLSCVLR